MKKGFTLIEITLAILIIVITSIGVVSIFSYGSGISTDTREISIATQAAQEEMELIRDMDFGGIVGTSFTTPGFAHLVNPAGTVTVSSYGGDSDIKKVTVTVSWTSAQGRSLGKSLVTLITKKGIGKK